MNTKLDEQKVCLVIGSISGAGNPDRTAADWLFEMIFEPVFEAYPEVRVERADARSKPPDAQGTNLLETADLVIALTGDKPDILYEIGVRHTSQKPIIHMVKTGSELPFEARPQETIYFDRAAPSDAKQVRKQLIEIVSAAIT